MILECRGIRKSYGTKENPVEVLKGIDLEVEKGELRSIRKSFRISFPEDSSSEWPSAGRS